MMSYLCMGDFWELRQQLKRHVQSIITHLHNAAAKRRFFQPVPLLQIVEDLMI